MIITIVVVTTFIAIPLAIFLVKRRKNNYEEISNLFQINDDNLSKPIYKNGKFENPWSTWSKPKFTKYLKYLALDKNEADIPSKQVLDETLPVHEITDNEINEFCKSDPNGKIKSIWLGHASLMVNIENKIILTDPVLGESVSHKIGIKDSKRFRDVPIKINRIPRVDVILLSHDHYDHLDEYSVIELNKKFGDSLTWLIPVGTAKWFESVGVKNNVYEFSWWQSKTIFNLEFVYTPAQHWSTNSNRSLWGGWVVIGPKKRFYFAGDTGYCPAFTEIGRKYGPLDLSFIPIGAYKPRWMFSSVHVDPWDAVKIHLDVKSNKSVAIHWGTFRFGHEFYLAPREELGLAAKNSSLRPDEFKTYQHGQICLF